MDVTSVTGNNSWKFHMIRWWEHSQKCVTDGRTDRQTDWTIHRAAWSQLKNIHPELYMLYNRHDKMPYFSRFIAKSWLNDLQDIDRGQTGLGSIPFFQFNSNSNSFTFNSNSNSNSFGMKNSNSNSNSFLSIPIPIPFYQFLFKAELNPTDNLSWL